MRMYHTVGIVCLVELDGIIPKEESHERCFAESRGNWQWAEAESEGGGDNGAVVGGAGVGGRQFFVCGEF
jgi:hypothetical protein